MVTNDSRRSPTTVDGNQRFSLSYDVSSCLSLFYFFLRWSPFFFLRRPFNFFSFPLANRVQWATVRGVPHQRDLSMQFGYPHLYRRLGTSFVNISSLRGVHKAIYSAFHLSANGPLYLVVFSFSYRKFLPKAEKSAKPYPA